jgi:hypothetical protein
MELRIVWGPTRISMFERARVRGKEGGGGGTRIHMAGWII